MWIVGVLMLGGASGDGCGPVQPPADGDDTGLGATVDAGTLSDEEIALDWRLYGEWDAGACLELKFTNLGARVTSWQFAIGLDRVVRDVAYGGSNPSSFSVVLDEARLIPFAEPILQPFGTVTYATCLEPVVRPVSFDATIVRDGDDGADEEVPEADVYGRLYEDGRVMSLEWLDSNRDPTAFCLELRLGNTTEDRLESWTARVQFDEDVVIRSTDTTFTFLEADLDALDIRPTNTSAVFDPLDVHAGTLCLDRVAEPTSLTATYVRIPLDDPFPAAPPIPPQPARQARRAVVHSPGSWAVAIAPGRPAARP